jgi:hypothetical protein
MKKSVFTKWLMIITILVPFLGSASASNPNLPLFSQDESNFSFGPKASFHFNKLYLNQNFTSSFEPGFEGGLFIRFGKKWYMQPELLYSFRQTNFEVLLDEVNTNIAAQNHYVILPILIGYKILNGESSNIRLLFGPKFAYRLATNKPEFDDILKPFEYGCEVGLGLDVSIVTLDISYNFYFSQSNTNELSQNILHQSMFNASLGIKF